MIESSLHLDCLSIEHEKFDDHHALILAEALPKSKLSILSISSTSITDTSANDLLFKGNLRTISFSPSLSLNALPRAIETGRIRSLTINEKEGDLSRVKL